MKDKIFIDLGSLPITNIISEGGYFHISITNNETKKLCDAIISKRINDPIRVMLESEIKLPYVEGGPLLVIKPFCNDLECEYVTNIIANYTLPERTIWNEDIESFMDPGSGIFKFDLEEGSITLEINLV